MKNARMNISHFRFILLNLKIFGEIVTTKFFGEVLLLLPSFYYLTYIKPRFNSVARKHFDA